MNPFFSDVNFFRGWFEIYEFIGRRQIHFGSFLLFPRVHRVFCRSACLMWQCVTPSNFQTSTLWSRRYLADTPFSPISTLLPLCSSIIFFHFSLNSHWPDCCCTIVIITLELTGFLCFFIPYKFLLLRHIYKFVLRHRHRWRPILIYKSV